METKIKYVVFDLKGQAEVFMTKFHEFGYTDFINKMVKVSPYEVSLEVAIDGETETDEAGFCQKLSKANSANNCISTTCTFKTLLLSLRYNK